MMQLSVLNTRWEPVSCSKPEVTECSAAEVGVSVCVSGVAVDKEIM